ncbi:MAG: hypothetical protein ACI91T_002068 [Natronomonas sp.]|jgi:hypothetical protein
MDRSSRRDFLRAGAAVATMGTVGVGSLSGCLGVLIGGGTERSALDVVTRWWAVPSQLTETADRSPARYVRCVSPSAVAEANDRVSGDLLRRGARRFETQFRPFDVTYREVAFRFRPGDWELLEVGHDRGRAANALRANGFRKATEHRGFAVFAESDRPDSGGGDADQGRLYAFDGSIVLTTRRGLWPPDGGVRAITGLIDAGQGKLDRVPETDDTVGGLLSAARHGDFAFVDRKDRVAADEADPEFGRFEGQIGSCSAGEFGTDALHFQSLTLFSDSSAVDIEAVRQYVRTLEDEDRGVFGTTETSVDRRGRLIEITFVVSLESLVD